MQIKQGDKMSHTGSYLIYGFIYIIFRGTAHMCVFIFETVRSDVFNIYYIYFLITRSIWKTYEQHSNMNILNSAVVKIRHRNRSIQLSFDLLLKLSRSQEFVIHLHAYFRHCFYSYECDESFRQDDCWISNWM